MIFDKKSINFIYQYALACIDCLKSFKGQNLLSKRNMSDICFETEQCALLPKSVFLMSPCQPNDKMLHISKQDSYDLTNQKHSYYPSVHLFSLMLW